RSQQRLAHLHGRRRLAAHWAARRTALATVSATPGVNTLGMISSAVGSETMAAMASAAASFIASVICFAPESSAPRKIPGKARTLLIWFGKSERPVPTIDAYFWATSG